jgi:hypothetical protein
LQGRRVKPKAAPDHARPAETIASTPAAFAAMVPFRRVGLWRVSCLGQWAMCWGTRGRFGRSSDAAVVMGMTVPRVGRPRTPQSVADGNLA